MSITRVGGNAFNQLAVLSLQAHDQAAAVHFYFRSLAVAQPFPMARENLIMLFEGTRQKADGLKAGSKGVITVASSRGRGGGLKVLREGRRPTRPIQQLLEELPVRFVHMHGGSLHCLNTFRNQMEPFEKSLQSTPLSPYHAPATNLVGTITTGKTLSGRIGGRTNPRFTCWTQGVSCLDALDAHGQQVLDEIRQAPRTDIIGWGHTQHGSKPKRSSGP